MRHATVFLFVCLAVCHGRPITPTVPTPKVPTPMSTVNALPHNFPTTVTSPTQRRDSNLHSAGDPLTAVTTTSEEQTTTFTTTSSPITSEAPKTTVTSPNTVITTTTVTPSTTVEGLPDLHEKFELHNCDNIGSLCYFPSECIHPSEPSDVLSPLLQSPSLLSQAQRLSLTNCPVSAIISQYSIQLFRTGPISPVKEMRLPEFGFTIESDGEARCAVCVSQDAQVVVSHVRLDFYVLPQTTTKNVRPATTWPISRTTRARKHQLPLPTTPSLPADPDDVTEEGQQGAASSGSSVTEIIIISLLVIIGLIVLALCISIYQIQRKQVVPVPQAPKIAPAWPSSRSSSSIASEWPVIPDDSTEDFDERTPAAVSPVKTANTVSSASSTKLMVPQTPIMNDKEATTPDVSAKPPTPPRVSPSKDPISVTPSKDPELKKLKSPERKRPKLESSASTIQSKPRTPLNAKQRPIASLYDEASTQ